MTIHIKKENRGKFTAKAKAAGKGVQEYARQVMSAPEGRYPPSTRRQANFARNASKWNVGGSVPQRPPNVPASADWYPEYQFWSDGNYNWNPSGKVIDTAKKNVGGPLAPAPSGATGAAHAPIQAYLEGGSGSAPQLSYQQGMVKGAQDQAIADQRSLRELQEGGIGEDVAQQLVYSGAIDQGGGEDRGLTPMELERLQKTGHAGHVIGENTIGGWRKWDPASNKQGLTVEQRLDPNYSHMKIPGVGTAMMGGIGGINRKQQRALVDKGGVTYNINGQPVTVGPQGQVVGTLPQGVQRGDVVKWAEGQGQQITRPEGIFSGFLGDVKGALGLQAAEDKRVADAEAAKQAAIAARANAARQVYGSSGDDNDHGWTSVGGSERGGRTNTATGTFSGNQTGLGSGPTAGGFGGTGVGRSGYNIGGDVMDDDVWGTDPLAKMAKAVDLGAGRSAGAPAIQAPRPQEDPLYSMAKKAAITGATNYMMPSWAGGMGAFMGVNEGGEVEEKPKRTIWGLAEKLGQSDKVEKYRGKDDNISIKLNAGGWVGRRVAHLVNGGMAQPPAEMQAFNEMQSMTGPDPVGAEFMMPEGSPMPEEYSPENNFGYVPSGGMSYKEQGEADKVYIQREKAMQDEDRKERAFKEGERRKEQSHQMGMQQKKESHAESMKQKRAGPLAGG